jgi:O-antigen/teichoic acid export membrane protein
MAGIGVIILIIISPWLATVMLKMPHLSTPLIIGCGFLFCSAVNGYQMGALSGLEAYGSLAKAGTISGAVTIIVVSIGALLAGLNGALIGLSVSALIRCFIHNIYLRIESRTQNIICLYKNSLNLEKTILFKFALPAALAGYYSMPIFWLANSLLVRQPGGYEQMALYASASSLRMVVMFVPQVINTVTLSILNHVKGSGDVQNYKLIYKYNILFIFFTAAIGALIIGFFGNYILIVFGKSFISGKQILQILMISVVFEGIALALYQHLQSHEKIWTSFFMITIPRETAFIIFAFVLIPSYGAIGLSTAYTLCWFLAFVIICTLVYIEKINIENKSLGIIPLTTKA